MQLRFAVCSLATATAQDIFLAAQNKGHRVTVKSDLSVVGTVDAREVSFAVDDWFLKTGHSNLDFKDARLRSLVSEFHPFVIRTSGTGAEDLIFAEDPEAYMTIPARVQKVLTGTVDGHPGGTDLHNVSIGAFNELADFVKATGADFVLGFNQLLRDYDAGYGGCDGPGRCEWIAKNAKAWMRYNIGIGLPVYGYELGNEPGCYMPKIAMNASHVRRDFAAFKAAIEDVYGTDGPLTIGPDVGGCRHYNYMDTDLLLEKPPLDIVTFHHYVMPSAAKHNYTVSDYINAAKTNKTRDEFHNYEAVRDKHLPGVPLWHGEGASTFGHPTNSDSPGLHSFAFNYNYVNLLGQGGLNSVQVFAKQTLGSLVDTNSQGVYEPLAQYWTALLWKRLVGTTVYTATTTGEDDLLAFARSGRSYGNVTFVLANLLDKGRQVPINVNVGNVCDLYELTPVEDPRDTAVLLNGASPPVNQDGSVPELTPTTLACDELSMSPLAIAFVVVH